MKLPVIATGASSVRCSRSTVSEAGTVTPTPDALLAQARAIVPGLARDAYALARVIASEFGNGTTAEQACIGDADINRAQRAGMNLFDHIARGGAFGRQGTGGRVVASSQDPMLSHVVLAQALLAGEARGIAAHGTTYFDPFVQLDGHNAGKRYLHPLVVLEKWTYNKPAQALRMAGGRYVCDLGPAASSGQMEWVGVIDGVRPTRLMLFRPRTAAQEKNTTSARAVLQAMLGNTTSLLAAAVVVAGGMLL